ncbi:glucans biosynthesis glucosyltransferase MdoH [Paracraurococcus lichenis]|uniref:Glucans biosynthesis glucosyltransferase H n=1 Tax=Paracraurococcus lichenis TaxID=3064888 RepID=A0ABT9E7K4_9PROT|nr:glucans biosynthesis glucosyltransferase MdoH [Paracraurococcus sp. LOR1-02]MDO9712177.1 glucans biosynthesis glucosyltransferase MdoH [Paracraurococcus sp. LOR1-02]
MERLGPRRAAMLALTAGLTLGLLALAWPVLAGGGWTVWEALILLCLAVNAPWLGLAAATGLAGLAIRLLARDPDAMVLPALRAAEGPVAGRTLLACCVRLEDMGAVLPPLARLLRDLQAEHGDAFVLGILSDTPAGPDAAAEAAAVAALAARFPPGAVRYRRRAANTGFKAGNLMDFLDRHAAGFDFALVLDADSEMTAAAVLRLVRVMQADPGLAILQANTAPTGAETACARLLGLRIRHGGRIWSTGQAWWQGPAGPYWGHNALLRIAAFRRDARLPLLPGGAHILSHDHAEAAMLHAAGWGVRVLPDDAGSHERHPPDLQALFGRDLRWAAGNMQYLRLLRRPEFGRLGRFQMLLAVLHYALAPPWLALLPLAALNVATGGGEGTPRDLLLALLLAGFAAANLPALAGYAEALLRPGLGTRGLGQALLFGLLLDVLEALERTATLAVLGLRRLGGWAPQRREARAIGWAEAARRFGPQTLAGLALAAAFASGGAFPLLAALPALAGLLLAVPLAVLTARPEAPRRRHPAALRPARPPAE